MLFFQFTEVSKLKVQKIFVFERLRGFEQFSLFLSTLRNLWYCLLMGNSLMSQCLSFHSLEASPEWEFLAPDTNFTSLKSCFSFWVTELWFGPPVTELGLVHILWGVNYFLFLNLTHSTQLTHKVDAVEVTSSFIQRKRTWYCSKWGVFWKYQILSRLNPECSWWIKTLSETFIPATTSSFWAPEPVLDCRGSLHKLESGVHWRGHLRTAVLTSPRALGVMWRMQAIL